MFWLWLIIAIVLMAIGSYVIGAIDGPDDRVGLFWIVFIVSLLWPFVLMAVLITGPFFGLFWLGDRKREKIKAAAKETDK